MHPVYQIIMKVLIFFLHHDKSPEQTFENRIFIITLNKFVQIPTRGPLSGKHIFLFDCPNLNLTIFATALRLRSMTFNSVSPIGQNKHEKFH